MSAGGFGASGFLQGFAESYNRARQLTLQRDLDQRHLLAGTLLQLYPNSRPEAQQDIAQRILTIYSTPPGKKLPKELSDVNTLGHAQEQQNAVQLYQQAKARAPGQAAAGAAATSGPQTVPSLPAPPGAPEQPPAMTGTMTAPGASALTGPAPIPPPPTGGFSSPFLSPQERSEQAGKQAESVAAGTTSGQLAAHLHSYEQFKQQNPNATPQDYLVATGRGLPYGMVRPVPISRSVPGADLLKSNPDIVTTGGEQIDPNSTYDLVQIGGQTYAAPSGLGAQLTGANIKKAGAQTSELETREQLEKGRLSMIPYQTAKIIQDMQLNPEKVEIARTRAAASLLGPTNLSKQSGQFAADVEDKIDALMPTLINLAKEGKLGAIAGRWEDFLTGKIRAGSPEVANLQQQFDVLSKAVMRMHGFRNADEAAKYVAHFFSVGTDPEQLVGGLEGLRTSARTYELMGQFPPEIQQQITKALTSGKQVKPKGTERLPEPPSGGGGKTVQMRAPDGTVKPVPADQVEHYKSLGATVVR